MKPVHRWPATVTWRYLAYLAQRQQRRARTFADSPNGTHSYQGTYQRRSSALWL